MYRKLHLFDVSIPERNISLKESDNVIGGKEIVEPVQTPAGLVGLAIVSLLLQYLQTFKLYLLNPHMLVL